MVAVALELYKRVAGPPLIQLITRQKNLPMGTTVLAPVVTTFTGVPPVWLATRVKLLFWAITTGLVPVTIKSGLRATISRAKSA